MDRPISTVLSDIMGNVQAIIRSEARLVKTEVSEELKKSSGAAIMIGAGLVMLIFSGLFVLVAAVYALSQVVPFWAAALIVAAGEGLMAALLVGLGIRKLRHVRAVPKTAETMKENVEWAKHPTR
ncbi:MAG TPA: phage holin family protein [Steroidobacteraceae bacterium]|nr:phage holin family protein [Steroidobacteraceae bacterium]